MRSIATWFWCAVLSFCVAAAVPVALADGDQIPVFGQDTVLVWKSENQGITGDFVVRIAGFNPDRFIEWEDSTNQGTVFMSSTDIEAAKGFVTSRLFEPGMDTKTKSNTTLWLSRKIYRELKEKHKFKCDLDGVPTLLTHKGEGQISVEVNGSPMDLPVIKVLDERGSERWFLDQEQNALMIKHTLRAYSEVLSSITTNKKNTLRWIKGKKLQSLHP